MRKLVFTVALLAFGLIIAYPILEITGCSEANKQIAGWFYHLCHQNPERTFNIFGVMLPVCARCTGLYSGFLIGAFLSNIEWFRRSYFRIEYLICLCLPLVIQLALQELNIADGDNYLRFTVAFILGVPLAIYICQGLNALQSSKTKWRNMHDANSKNPGVVSISSAAVRHADSLFEQ